MNILYHHRTRGRNVEAVHIMGIVNALRHRGHTVNILSPPGVEVEKIPGHSRNDSTKKKNTVIHHLIQKDYFRINFEIKEHLYNLYAFWKLIQNHNKNPVDLIYERYSLNCYAGVVFAQKNNIPIFLEVNDATGIDRVRKHTFEQAAGIIENKIFQAADHIFTISSFFKKELMKRGISSDKISINPNAVDEKKFDPFRSGQEVDLPAAIENKIIIGYVGQFVHWHGLHYLLEIMPEIINTFPNVYFIFVGEGKTFEECKNYIQTKGMTHYVLFTGNIPHDQVPGYLKKMDIGVIPDSNLYGSPMKLFEYMSMMCVPVAPRLDPMEDVITHGFNGLLFEPKNRGSMKETIFKLLSDEALRKQLSENARKSVLSSYLWKNNAESIISTYLKKVKKGSFEQDQ